MYCALIQLGYLTILEHVLMDDSMKKLVIPIVLLLVLGQVFAQEAKIDINHIGYGKTLNEAVFTIHSTGSITITDINVTVDGKLYKQINAVLPPNEGLQTSIFLDSGEHTIEVRTPEGAYDSLSLRISTAKQRLIPTESEQTPFLSRNVMIYTALGIVIIIFVVVTWLLIRKPKPKLEQAQSY